MDDANNAAGRTSGAQQSLATAAVYGVKSAALLPTPVARDHKDPVRPATGRPDDVSLLPRAIGHLLATPRATDGPNGGPGQRNGRGDPDSRPGLTPLLTDFGPYTAAVRRWEQTLGRPAPSPVEDSTGRPRLNPVFVEWMMGLAEGHVTDTPGLSRTAALKALGNGVVPQQALLALQLLTDSQDGTQHVPYEDK